MSMVQQTADGLVIIRSGSKNYLDKAANFALDFGEPAPTLPPECNDRVYEPGIRHACTDGVTVKYGGPMPWTSGDRYITNIDMGLTNQATRIANIPPPDPPPGGVTVTETSNAQLNTQASPDDGSSSPQPEFREEDGYTRVSG